MAVEVEMRKLQRSHMDAHDASFGHIKEILVANSEQINQLIAAQAVTESRLQSLLAAQAATDARFQSLIEALLREHSNGRTKG